MTNDDYLCVANDLSTLNLSIENHPFDEAIDELKDKIFSNQYKIAVVGDFSSGKSTFINALIGEELLYSSNIEATGVITTVQYGERPIAQICKKKNSDIADEVIDEVELIDEIGRKKLNDYLDIRNSLNIDQINIFYPIEGISKEIVFFDTPGIEKLSKKQVAMTKKIINEVNAVIFLITKKGFTKPSLKVISGEYEDIGKIPTNDIMVIMTHIGEIYDERKNDNPDAQVDKSLCEAKSMLIEKGIGNIPIIPVDSRDYLWGINEELYEREKNTRNVKLKGALLSRKDYQKRSRFEEFKSILYQHLDEDNLKKNREEGIRNNILLIAEALETELVKQHADGNEKKILLKNQLEKQIELACENQRKFYNRMIQQLQIHMEDFLENVEKDAEVKKKQTKDIISYISKKFITLEDINETNVKDCVDMTIDEINSFAVKIESETNSHIKITNQNFLKQIFSEQFRKIFDKTVEVQLEEVICDFSIILEENDYDIESVINDSDLEQLKLEKKEAEEQLVEFNQESVSLTWSISDGNKKYQERKNALEAWYDSEIHKLGDRPKARQKYREETRTKGFLFWKKTWVEKIPDGLDHSAGQAWDQRRRDLVSQYEGKSERLEREFEYLDESVSKIRKINNLIEAQQSIIKRLEGKIKKYNDYIEEGKRKYTQQYIDDKKEEVASICDEIRLRLIMQICDTVRIYINERKREMEKFIKDELKIQIDKYRSELEAKNKALSDSICVTTETKENAISNIQKIKEKMTYGKAV